MRVAISGASGKTGFRIAEEAMKAGYKIKLITRKDSILPKFQKSHETYKLSLNNKKDLDNALENVDTLIIATGARPSIDLFGPAKVDALGVKQQIDSCIKNNVKRVILVSSLCTGRLFHPLNLFGLILIWKKVGENILKSSGLDWTIIRPGGLNENEEDLNNQNIYYSKQETQEKGYIPRRLVAKACIEAIKTPQSIEKIIEITSNTECNKINMRRAIESF